MSKVVRFLLDDAGEVLRQLAPDEVGPCLYIEEQQNKVRYEYLLKVRANESIEAAKEGRWDDAKARLDDCRNIEEALKLTYESIQRLQKVVAQTPPLALTASHNWSRIVKVEV